MLALKPKRALIATVGGVGDHHQHGAMGAIAIGVYGSFKLVAICSPIAIPSPTGADRQPDLRRARTGRRPRSALPAMALSLLHLYLHGQTCLAVGPEEGRTLGWISPARALRAYSSAAGYRTARGACILPGASIWSSRRSRSVRCCCISSITTESRQVFLTMLWIVNLLPDHVACADRRRRSGHGPAPDARNGRGGVLPRHQHHRPRHGALMRRPGRRCDRRFAFRDAIGASSRSR